MTLRFQADVNLNELILRAACRREPALVFHTAAAASLGGLPDPKVLERAAEEGRILVTHDLQTMPRHFRALSATPFCPYDGRQAGLWYLPAGWRDTTCTNNIVRCGATA